eukprot:Em0018g1125a
MCELSKVDPNFEYDAPNYVDFDLLKQGVDDEEADRWFENHVDTQDKANGFGDEKSDIFGEDKTSDILEDTYAPVKVLPDRPAERHDEGAVETTSHANVVDAKEQTNSHDQGLAMDNRQLTAGEIILRKMQQDTKLPKKKFPPKSVPLAIESLLRKPLRPSSKVNNATLGHKAVSNAIAQKAESLTLPHTPGVLRRQEKKRPFPSKTTEELEMEQVEELKKEAQLKLELSKRSFQMLSKQAEPVAVKRAKHTTEPVEFNFKTSERCKPSAPSAMDNSITVNPSNFPLLLRNSLKEEKVQPTAPTSSSRGGVTIAKPFKFTLDERLHKDSKAVANETIIPTAEAVEKYQKQTPPRFRSNPSKNTIQSNSRTTGTYELTVPKTPCLLTKNRSRPTTVMSTAEVEEEEIAKLKEYKFRANPINPKIFNKNGLYGVPKRPVDQVSTTVPESPHLATKERMESRKRKLEDGENPAHYEFHAHPIQKGILEGVKGVPERAPPPLTCAVSPAFALKRRKLGEALRPTSSEESRPDHPVIKANPMPDFSKVFVPITSHKATEVVPFTFEERYQSKPSLVQQILEKEKEKENRPFKANPLPSFSTPSLPSKAVKPITQPEPFNLESELRGQQYWSKFQEELKAKQLQAKTEAEFVARDCKVLEQEPYIPHKSFKPLTEVSNFVLHTEIQSEQRKKFDEEQRQREMMMKQEEMEKKALKEAEDAIALKELRNSLVHKAQPIHHYAPVEIHPSDRPITMPVTPELRTATRLRTVTTHN